MRRYRIVVLAALCLAVAGCGAGTPSAEWVWAAHQNSAPRPAPSKSAPPKSTPPKSTPPKEKPPGLPAPSTDVRACYEADCVLVLTGPVTIPLDAAKLHYSTMIVTAISTESITYDVPYPNGGGAETQTGPGLNTGSFGFSGSPTVEVGLEVVSGKPALVLQLGPAS